MLVAFICEFQRPWPVLLYQQPSSGNQQPSTGSFQNQQPPKKTRKRGIAALLDKTNQICEQSSAQRLCKETARARVATQVTPFILFEERGDPAKGGKAHAKIVQRKDNQESACTLYSVFTKNKTLFNQGKEFVSKYVSRNISWEVQKAIAIQTMTTAMTELGVGVVQAANFAGTLTGFSGQVVRRWASALFATLAQYPGSLDDVDDSFIELELSSERGKACGNPTAIIHDEEFCLAAREYIRFNAYRKGEPNLTADMFRAWVSGSYKVDICVDTARTWLHHLGFHQCDHQKGVYFDGHE